MGHDATKVLMGNTTSSAKDVSNFASDPATFIAGLAVRETSTGVLSVAVGAGGLMGVSLGKSLSDTKRTAVCRTGERVPILLTTDFVPAIGAAVWVDDVTGKAQAAFEDMVTASTVTNAIYVTGVLTGIQEDETTASVALIDMPGGL